MISVAQMCKDTNSKPIANQHENQFEKRNF